MKQKKEMDIPLSDKVSQRKLELLAKLQRLDVPDEVWFEISSIIADYLSDRTISKANQVVDEKGWTDDDFHRMAHTHMRTPYQPQFHGSSGGP
ncbi:MAG: hypothetical protein OXF06_13835 [Bacteroidetes bacterium]|nr:hypothetical protein [Bacteroidota bacterium]MCY4225895.1 hypothetical protein [Bacteroidota bacterium]